MFKKLIEKISEKVTNNLRKEIHNEVITFVADIIKSSFNNSYALSKNCRNWNDEDRYLIKKAITEVFDKNISSQVSEEVAKSVSNQMTFIKEEAFIDEIVERIRKKQI